MSVCLTDGTHYVLLFMGKLKNWDIYSIQYNTNLLRTNLSY